MLRLKPHTLSAPRRLLLSSAWSSTTNKGLKTFALASSALVLSACVGKNTPDSNVGSSSSMSSSSVAVSSSAASSTPASSSSLAVSSTPVSSTPTQSSSAQSSSESSEGPFQTLRIQAQDYNRDDFNESTPGTREGMASGVCAAGGDELIDLENVTDQNGVCAISYTEVGEYVQYTLNIPAGNYDIALRNASDTGSSATQSVSINGANLGNVQTVAQGWSNAYGTSVLYNVAINSGEQILRITFEGAASNLNYIEISESNGAPTSSSAANSSAPSGNGASLGDTVDDISFNPAKSKGVKRYGSPEFYLGGFEAGNYACFDNINLTGVKSLDLRYGRLHDSIGQVAVYLGSADILEDPNAANPEQGSNLGEFRTISTGAYENFDTVTFRLNQAVEGEQTVCFRAVFGGGVMNLDSFTLSADDTGQNITPTNYTFSAPTAPTTLPAITVQDGQVLYGGEAKSIAGISLFWSNFGWGGSGYYNAGAIKSIKENWNAKLVRVAFGTDDFGSYMDDFWSHRLKLFEVVNAAIENDMYVIIDWHAHKINRDSTNPALNPEAFFKEMATKYGSYTNVIYEIFNEPLEESWDTSIKPYAENVIKDIRAIDPDNLIIVGTRTWSQRVDEAARNQIAGINIAYTLHFYAATHRLNQFKTYIDVAKQEKAAIFVTEWGTVEAAGTGNPDNAESLAWMDYLHANKISHANWALVDNQTKERINPSSDKHGSSILNLGSDFNGNWSTGDLTPSGELVMDILQNWDNWDAWNKAPYK